MSPNPTWPVSLEEGDFGHRDRHIERECDVKTQGDHQAQAMEHLRLPQAGREAWNRSSSEVNKLLPIFISHVQPPEGQNSKLLLFNSRSLRYYVVADLAD